MNIMYKCSFCHAEFSNSEECIKHELTHMNNAEKIKHELKYAAKSLCDYCDHSYYVYGCERDCTHKDCSYKNNYKDFIPVEPLHDKSIHGV